MPFVKREYEYYKYGTEPDATVVGSFARLDKGVASGFSSANYLTLDNSFSPQSNTWEIVFAFATSGDISATQVLVDSNNGLSSRPIGIYINNSKMKIVLSSSTSDNNIAKDVEGTKTLSPNTKYYYKLEFDGSSYIGSISSDGLSWEVDININSSVSILSGYPFIIGQHTNKTYLQTFLGSIDLTQSYIKINDELWWSGDSYTKVGSWIDDGVVSGFTAAGNQLKFTKFFRPENNTWERVMCITTGANFSADFMAVDTTCANSTSTRTNYMGFMLTTKPSGKLAVSISSVNTAWNIANESLGVTVLQPNTKYYVKSLYDGSSYKVLLSPTGEFRGEETIEMNIASSTPIWQGNTNLIDSIGVHSGSEAYPFNGSVDLNESYININNKLWWRGTKAVEATVDDYDYYETKNKLYQLVKPKRTYYKYGNEIDANVNGSFGRITDGVAGGFIASNHLVLPETIEAGSNTWERVVKIYTGSDVSTEQTIMGTLVDSRGFLLRLRSGNLCMWSSSNGSSWNMFSNATSSLTLSAYTGYYIKTSFNGSQYLVDVSTDGVDYTNYITVTSSSKVISNVITLGAHGNSGNPDTPFKGSIDLSKSYIKVADEIVWNGDNYTKVGSWIDDGVVSGFTTSNYLKLPNTFAPSSNTWEMYFKVTTGSNVKAEQSVIGQTSVSYGGIWLSLGRDNINVFNLALSSGTGSWDIANHIVGTHTIEANTEYEVLITFNGSEYKMYVDSELDISVISSKAISAYTNLVGLVQTGGNTNNYPWLGSIDLAKSYINIDGERWWHGTKAVEVNLGSNDIIEDWEQPVLTSDITYGKTSSTQLYSGNYAYYAFDGNITSSGKYLSNTTGSGNVAWELPEPIKIKSFQVYQTTETSYLFRFPRAIGFEGSKDGVVWVSLGWIPSGSYSQPASGQAIDFNVKHPDFYKYYRWAFGGAFGADAGVAIGDIKINAEILEMIGSNTYDYYQDRLLSYSPILNNKLY